MQNYNETNIDLLLEQELEKLKALVEKLQKTNENVIENATQIEAIKQKYADITLAIKAIESKIPKVPNLDDFVDKADLQILLEKINAQFSDEIVVKTISQIEEIKQKYEEIALSISDVESKIPKALNPDEFVAKEAFQILLEEIDAQYSLVQKAQTIQQEKLALVDEFGKSLSTKIEKSLNEKLIQFVRLDSFEKEINDIQQTNKKTTSNALLKSEVEEIKQTLAIVIKDIGDIYRLAGEIDKERFLKFETKTNETFRKMKDELSNCQLTIERQSKKLNSFNEIFKTVVTPSNLESLESKIKDRVSKKYKEMNDLKEQNTHFSAQLKNQKRINLIFAGVFFILFVLHSMGGNSAYKTINKRITSLITNIL